MTGQTIILAENTENHFTNFLNNYGHEPTGRLEPAVRLAQHTSRCDLPSTHMGNNLLFGNWGDSNNHLKSAYGYWKAVNSMLAGKAGTVALVIDERKTMTSLEQTRDIEDLVTPAITFTVGVLADENTGYDFTGYRHDAELYKELQRVTFLRTIAMLTLQSCTRVEIDVVGDPKIEERDQSLVPFLCLGAPLISGDPLRYSLERVAWGRNIIFGKVGLRMFSQALLEETDFDFDTLNIPSGDN